MDDDKYNKLINKSKFFKAIKAVSPKIIEPITESVSKTIKLNIGSGPNIFPYDGWINYDHENFDQYFLWLKHTTQLIPEASWPKEGPGSLKSLKKLHEYLQNHDPIFAIHDLRTGLPQHADNSVDLIYFGQVIEHLNPIHEMPKFLKECYRVLAPGGIIRLTTPDLDVLIQAYLSHSLDRFAVEQPSFYKEADESSKLAYIMFGSSGQDCSTTHYEGHMFLFSKISMTKALEEAGFKNIEFFSESGKSKSPILKNEVVDAGLTHSFIVEAVK
jgi:predicted SAM-dependent methyltransferase